MWFSWQHLKTITDSVALSAVWLPALGSLFPLSSSPSLLVYLFFLFFFLLNYCPDCCGQVQTWSIHTVVLGCLDLHLPWCMYQGLCSSLYHHIWQSIVSLQIILLYCSSSHMHFNVFVFGSKTFSHQLASTSLPFFKAAV